MVFGPPAAGDRRQTAVPGGGEGGEEIRLVRLRAQQEPGRTGNGPGTGGTRTPRTPTQAGIHGGMRRGLGQDRSHGDPPPPRSRGGLLGGGGGEMLLPSWGLPQHPNSRGMDSAPGWGDMRSQCSSMVLHAQRGATAQPPVQPGTPQHPKIIPPPPPLPLPLLLRSLSATEPTRKRPRGSPRCASSRRRTRRSGCVGASAPAPPRIATAPTKKRPCREPSSPRSPDTAAPHRDGGYGAHGSSGPRGC